MRTLPEPPWYREPWPWILMAAPLAAVLGGLVTLYLAVSSSDGLVADDYYMRGLAINQVIRRTQDAQRRGVGAKVNFDEVKHSIRVALRGDLRSGPTPVLRLAHPTRAGGDRMIALLRTGAGDYEGELSLPAAGRWHVILESPQWRITGTWSVPEQHSFTLTPGDSALSGRDGVGQGRW